MQVGVGMCMEGIEHNPIVYELMSEMAFRDEKVKINVMLFIYTLSRITYFEICIYWFSFSPSYRLCYTLKICCCYENKKVSNNGLHQLIRFFIK